MFSSTIGKFNIESIQLYIMYRRNTIFQIKLYFICLSFLYILAYINKTGLYQMDSSKFQHDLMSRSFITKKVEYIKVAYDSAASRRPMGTPHESSLDLQQILATDVFSTTNHEILNMVADLTEVSRVACAKTVVLGGRRYCFNGTSVYDGYKSMCLDKAVMPIPKNCTVLSFGVGNEFSFDDASALYGCKVYSFDFTMKNLTNSCYGPGKHFIDFGLSYNNVERMTYYTNKKDNPKSYFVSSRFTLQTILEFLDLSETTIDYLKMDIEGSEWKVFSQILENPKSAQVLNKVNQIILEIHLEYFHRINSDYEETIQGLLEEFEVLRSLNNAGFRLLYWIPNSQTESMVLFGGTKIPMYKELHFIRKK